MTQPDLFPEARSRSPKLIWLDKHALSSYYSKRDKTWKCVNRLGWNEGTGETEEEACIDYANKFGIKFWTLE